MKISVLLRSKIENTTACANIAQMSKTKEAIDRELVVSTLSEEDLGQIINSYEFKKFKTAINKRLPHQDVLTYDTCRKRQIQMILLFNMTTRYHEYFKKKFSDTICFNASVDMACSFLSYDHFIDVRDWQKVTGTLLAIDKWDSMAVFIVFLLDCFESATREEYRQFNDSFSKLGVLIEAKRRALTRKPKKRQDRSRKVPLGAERY